MKASHSAASLILGGANPALVGSTGLGGTSLAGLRALTRTRSAGDGPTPRKALNESLRQGSLAKLQFCFTNGGHGMEWDGLIVSSVKGQAQELGVQVGWKIYMIDGLLMKDAREAWQKLQDAQWQWRVTTIVFVTDFRAIRAEQKLVAFEEAKAEEERLAKLPFSNPHDEKHLAQIKLEFTFQGYVNNVEDRGTTMAQLQRIVTFSEERCHRWRDQAPNTVSRYSGRKLHIDFMNWCHVHDWLAIPSTQPKECSLLEMMTDQPQPPKYYLVHWWGDKLLNVMKCMKTHMQVRSLAEDTIYWIAFFANRPHSPQDNILLNQNETCFFKAMSASNFNILVVVDPRTEFTSAGTIFSRLWCCYELSHCLDAPNTVLDIVHGTVKASAKPSMVTERMTSEEKDMENVNKTAGYKAKMDREKRFSLQLMETALNLDVTSLHITDPVERRKILNSIAQRELGEELLEKHDQYDKMSIRLRSLCAMAFWRRIMTGSVSDSDLHRVQGKLMDTLRDDVWIRSLVMDLAFTKDGPEKLKLLATGFPPGLLELKLDLRELELVNENMAGLANALPKDLEDLTIDMRGNDLMHNIGIEDLMAKLPSKLRNLDLDLKKTDVSKEFQALQDNLYGLKKHIADEAAKADRCTIYSLEPSPSRHMIYKVAKTKLSVPPSS
eukprot:TRINITY_DN93542_c0_g1_i1.p1 TRINITY_DN93542_c0_g1~~TRINITY_DN93542_c0_g1_i1.p1  ORF type:complete len:665 (+),score=124.13 TRINITY_DN93542_c0_g1_i1:130-2124(+)